MRGIQRLILPVVAAAALAACDGGTGSKVQTAASIGSATGAVSTGAPLGSATTLSVKLADAAGAPVAGVKVSWTVSGGGTLSAPSSTTDAQGVARITLTMGNDFATAQPISVDATAKPGTVHFTVAGQVPADAVIEPVAGNGAATVAGNAVTLTARVRTAGGAPLANVPISFTGSCCEFSHPTTQTGPDGLATTEWTPTTAGAQTARASTSLTADDAAFAVTVSPAPYNHYQTLDPAGFTITAGETVSSPFRLKVLDRYNNPVPGVPVTWVARTGGVAVSPTSTVTDANGIASTQWQFNTQAGIQNFGAQVAGLDPTQDFRVTIVPGPFATLVFLQESRTLTDLSNSTQVQAQAQAFDAFGNLIAPSPAVTWSSTNPAVFTVAGTGTMGVLKYYYANLNAVAAGTARLRIQAANGVFAELPVTVAP